MTTRLAIFTSHPIQYQAPWFREIAGSSDIEPMVYFGKLPDPREQGIGFGKEFRWDIPLTNGYPFTVLKSRRLPKFVPRFASRVALDIEAQLTHFRPDVALILGWQDLMLVQALTACSRMGVPVIIRGDSNAKRHRPKAIRMLHQGYLGRTDACLAIGSSNREFYVANGVPPGGIASAPYFVDNEFFVERAASIAGGRETARMEWSIPAGSLGVLFVGKLQPKKRVFDFIKAIEIASQTNHRIHGLIVGSGEQMDEAQLRAMGLPITFAGFLNQTEITKAYVAADVIVLPSDFGETWGLVINEAMITGLPAIVSERVGCADDLVIEGKTGFVTPFADPEAIATALVRLENDREEVARLGSSAKAHVSENYSISGAMTGLRKAVDLAIAAHGKR